MAVRILPNNKYRSEPHPRLPDQEMIIIANHLL